VDQQLVGGGAIQRGASGRKCRVNAAGQLLVLRIVLRKRQIARGFAFITQVGSTVFNLMGSRRLCVVRRRKGGARRRTLCRFCAARGDLYEVQQFPR
jgi:hypothetical protein